MCVFCLLRERSSSFLNIIFFAGPVEPNEMYTIYLHVEYDNLLPPDIHDMLQGTFKMIVSGEMFSRLQIDRTKRSDCAHDTFAVCEVGV